MELRVLKYFLMVAREENITKAAQLLHVTQPTLSRQLMQLEEELGVQLFHRGKHNVTLTEDGMLLRRRAQELVSLSEKRRWNCSTRRKCPPVKLPSAAERRRAWRRSPRRWSLSVKSTRWSSSAFTALLQMTSRSALKRTAGYGAAGGACGYFQVRIYPSATERTVGRIGASRFSAGGERICHAGGLAWRSAADGAPRAGKNELANWFGDSFDQLEIAATYNLIVNAAFMVEQGLGVALCFDLGAVFENLRFVPLTPRMETGSVLVWKKNQMLSAANALFIQHIRNTI